LLCMRLRCKHNAGGGCGIKYSASSCDERKDMNRKEMLLPDKECSNCKSFDMSNPVRGINAIMCKNNGMVFSGDICSRYVAR
jgi:hypothetical protein